MLTAGALESGYLAAADVDAAFGRVAVTMIRLGLLDDAQHQPYAHLEATDVDTPAGAAAVASLLAAVLTELYLCNVRSCLAILRRSGRVD
eukprot:COSAG01_NODE_7332_length_3247_cov_2.094663_2_plen_90_part_00